MSDLRAENMTITKGMHDEEVPSVEIKVLFFARARDLTGVADIPLRVSSGSTAHDCLNKLVAEFPGLKDIRECMVLALNEEYASESMTVKERDELAIIPPISGGYGVQLLDTLEQLDIGKPRDIAVISDPSRFFSKTSFNLESVVTKF